MAVKYDITMGLGSISQSVYEVKIEILWKLVSF